jgi:hypothetical protein
MVMCRPDADISRDGAIIAGSGRKAARGECPVVAGCGRWHLADRDAGAPIIVSWF